MWGRPTERASPASAIASSMLSSKPSRRRLLDDLLGPADPLGLGALAGGGERLGVDPVAADMEVVGVCVDAGHLDRRHQLDPGALGRGGRAGTPATASWSVSASVVTPASAAASTTPAGSSCPSETVE